MENTKYSQPELFSQGNQNLKSSHLPQRLNVLAGLRQYERLLLTIILFIITSIIFYCWGVDRGKKIASSRSCIDLAVRTKVITPKQNSSFINQQAASTQSLPRMNIQQPLQELKADLAGYYTVQVASYKNRTIALKEAEQLKKNGFTSLILPKGSYVIVCVGNFTDKESARLVLAKLKNRYQDCMLRRL